MAIADAEGLDAVTIRRLAADFGVTPMALYWHVRNKEELLDAMGDRLFAGVAGRVVDAVDAVGSAGAAWPERLRVVMRALVDVLRAHPNATQLALARILRCEDGLLLTEQALEILRTAGMSVERAAGVAQQALFTAIMLVDGQPGGVTNCPPEDQEAKLAAKRATLLGLPADRFPRLLEAAVALTSCADEAAYYRAGVDMFIAGVEAGQADGVSYR